MLMTSIQFDATMLAPADPTAPPMLAPALRSPGPMADAANNAGAAGPAMGARAATTGAAALAMDAMGDKTVFARFPTLRKARPMTLPNFDISSFLRFLYLNTFSFDRTASLRRSRDS